MNTRTLILTTLAAALVLVLAGLYFVQKQRAVAPTGGGVSWDTVTSYIEPTAPEPVVEDAQTMPDVSAAQSNPKTLVIPKAQATTTSKIIPKAGDDSFDYNALLARLAHDEPQSAPQQGKTYEELIGAFKFVPRSQNAGAVPRTDEQEALFVYGNEIGRRLKGFIAVNPNMAQTVINQATHRDNKAYNDAVVELGNRYKALGEGILSFHDVPVSAEHAHRALGESYVALGEALSAVPSASNDQAFLSTITAYNNKAEAYTAAFVGMVTLFSSHDVTFDESDGGSAFSFRRN